MRRYAWIVVALVVLALWAWQQRAPTAFDAAPSPSASNVAQQATRADPLPTRPPRARRDDARYPAWLPREALATLQRIEHDGPFAHRQDGGVFHNRERRLPPRPRGYYREYTVATPGSRDRGARRIIAADDPPVEYFYTDDHYRSFRKFGAPPAGSTP